MSIKESIVYTFLASMTLVDINSLTYLVLMANWRDGDHHKNDVDNTVLTRAKFLKFREEARDENQ